MIEFESESESDKNDLEEETEVPKREKQQDDPDSAHTKQTREPEVIMTQVEDIAHDIAQTTQADTEDTISTEHTMQITSDVTSHDLSIVPYIDRRFQDSVLESQKIVLFLRKWPLALCTKLLVQ